MNQAKNPESTAHHVELEKGVLSVGAIFGVGGLSVDVKAGNRWETRKHKDGITINVNPNGIRDDVAFTPAEALYAAAHEVGHAVDMIQEKGIKVQKESDRFFWNVVDDAVINSRLHLLPRMQTARPGVFEKCFPSTDHRSDSRHTQFVHALLLGTVFPEGEYEFDPEIVTLVEGVRNYQARNGQSVDIMAVLAQLRTSLEDRRRLASIYIKPIYDRLLRQDKDEQEQSDQGEQGEKGEKGEPQGGDNQDQQGDPQDSSGEPGDFSKEYKAYQKAMHGDSHDDESAGEEEPGDETGKKGKGKPGDKDSDEKNGEKESSDSEKSDQEEDGNEQGSSRGDSQEQGEQEPTRGVSAEEIADAIEEVIEEQKARAAAAIEEDEADTSEDDSELADKMAGYIRQEMNLNKSDARRYFETLRKYRNEISAVADAFLLLAAHTDAMSSPRFDHRADHDGKRLHPLRLSKAALQSTTRNRYPIWQPISRRGKRQELDFGGLDVHLLGDVSTSMRGRNAEAASESGVILLEGLQLAKQRAAASSAIHTTPDVRVQVIAFGSWEEVLSPIGHDVKEKDKGRAFYYLSHPDSGATYVGGALGEVADAAEASPQRDQLVIIVTDGKFADNDDAADKVRRLGEDAFVLQININMPSKSAITPNAIGINNPKDLPRMMHAIIQQYVDSILV
jgi:hypothetical protein